MLKTAIQLKSADRRRARLGLGAMFTLGDQIKTVYVKLHLLPSKVTVFFLYLVKTYAR